MKNLIKTIVTISLIGAFSQAQAIDGTHYNGSYCNSFQPTEANEFVRDSSGIKNTSSEELYITCPVIVASPDVTSGTHTTWIHFSGYGAMECTLASMYPDGSLRQSRSNFIWNSGWMSIPDLNNDDRWGSYTLECSLPPGGTLNTISIRERN